MLDFEILLPHPFTRVDLLVTYAAGPAEEQRSKDATERIDGAWESLRADCRQDRLPVFDGCLFRLNSYAQEESKTVLELGDTTFREYVGTSVEDFYNTFPEAWMANPLAVCIALVTVDRKILVEKRKALTRYRAPLHVIGGFMERQKDFRDGCPDPFLTITREVNEELGVILPPDGIIALGLVRNLWIRHPEIVFYCRLSETFEEIRAILRRGSTDGEIEQLEAVNDSSDELALFLRDHHGLFTPSGEACLLLYGKRMYGDDWFNRLLQDLTLK